MAKTPNIDQLFNLRAAFPTDAETDAFFKAARNNDIKTLRKTIEKWPDAPKEWLSGGDPVLLDEFEDLTPKTIEFLVRNGADVNQFDNDNYWSPLLKAANRGNLECVEKLLRAGANADQRNEYGHSALKYAAEEGHFACADMLVLCGADPAGGLDHASSDKMRDVINGAKQRRDAFLATLDAPAPAGAPLPVAAAPAAAEPHAINIMRTLEFKKRGTPLPETPAPSAARRWVNRIFNS